MEPQDPTGQSGTEENSYLEGIVLQAKDRTSNPFAVLGLDPWIIQWLPEDDLREFLKSYRKTIARFVHADRGGGALQTEYLTAVNAALDDLFGDPWFFRQSKRSFNSRELFAKSEAGKKILEDSLKHERSTAQRKEREYTRVLKERESEYTEKTRKLETQYALELQRRDNENDHARSLFSACETLSEQKERILQRAQNSTRRFEKLNNGLVFKQSKKYSITGVVFSDRAIPSQLLNLTQHTEQELHQYAVDYFERNKRFSLPQHIKGTLAAGEFTGIKQLSQEKSITVRGKYQGVIPYQSLHLLLLSLEADRKMRIIYRDLFLREDIIAAEVKYSQFLESNNFANEKLSRNLQQLIACSTPQYHEGKPLFICRKNAEGLAVSGFLMYATHIREITDSENKP